jgi:hypothetical protein
MLFVLELEEGLLLTLLVLLVLVVVDLVGEITSPLFLGKHTQLLLGRVERQLLLELLMLAATVCLSTWLLFLV